MSYEIKIKKIIELLLSDSHYLTLDLIAQKTGYSKRSVQNYLADLDNWITKNGLLHTKTIKKQGKGIIIAADAVDRIKIEKLLSGRSLSIHGDDNKRRLEIIKKMIILEDDVTIKSLSDEFYVSRSVVISDLEWVREWLSAYRLSLTIDKSITVSGGEVSHRNAIAGYFDSYKSQESGEVASEKNHVRLHGKSLQDLMKIYPWDTVEKVNGIIELSEQKFDFFLTDDYYTSLLTHIVISVSRFLNGNTVPPEFMPPDDEEFPPFIMETADYISSRLETVFDIKVSDVERTYICIHLVGFNALSAKCPENSEIPKKIKFLALELIKAVDMVMDMRFISDELLFFGLCHHLKSQVFRLQKNVYYKKTSKIQLPDSDIAIYNAVIGTSDLYEKICGVKPDEEELLSIACYFMLSLHRNMRKPRVLLICNEGIIERMELMNKLGNALPSVDIADCCATYQMKYQTINDYDLLISTEAVDYSEKPVVDLTSVSRDCYTDYIQCYLNTNDI